MKSSDRKINKKICPFVCKLINILDDPQSQNCMSWASESTFMVADCDELSHHVLRKYFKHNNFSSFIRQLNIYGFQKVKSQENSHFYRHPNFIQHNRRQLKLIQRKSRKDETLHNSNIQIDASDSIEVETQIQKLRRQNEQMQKENKMLHEQIKVIQDGNRSQMERILSFFSELAKTSSQTKAGNIERGKQKQALHEKLQSLLKNQLEMCKQTHKMPSKADFDSIFKLLHEVVSDSEKEGYTLEENYQQIKEEEISNLYNLCINEVNQPIFSQKQRTGCLDLSQYSSMHNLF